MTPTRVIDVPPADLDDLRARLRNTRWPAVALFPADLTEPPRIWAERTYAVARYTTMPRGGHFAPHEEPELLANDLREFFRTLR